VVLKDAAALATLLVCRVTVVGEVLLVLLPALAKLLRDSVMLPIVVTFARAYHCSPSLVFSREVGTKKST